MLIRSNFDISGHFFARLIAACIAPRVTSNWVASAVRLQPVRDNLYIFLSSNFLGRPSLGAYPHFGHFILHPVGPTEVQAVRPLTRRLGAPHSERNTLPAKRVQNTEKTVFKLNHLIIRFVSDVSDFDLFHFHSLLSEYSMTYRV